MKADYIGRITSLQTRNPLASAPNLENVVTNQSSGHSLPQQIPLLASPPRWRPPLPVPALGKPLELNGTARRGGYLDACEPSERMAERSSTSRLSMRSSAWVVRWRKREEQWSQ